MTVACFAMPQIGIAVERARITHLWGEPLALAAPDDTIAALSDEAARFGIRAGQSASGARALCERLTMLPYDGPAYEEAAHAIWDLFAIESSVVEPVSPELCYVELPDKDALEIAQGLSRQLALRIRIPVCIGLARTKFVARQVSLGQMEEGSRDPSSRGAPASVHDSPSFLSRVPLHQAGIDPGLLQRLQRLGIHTFGDLRKVSPRALQRQFKEAGYILHRLAIGEDGDRVRPLWPPRRIERLIAFEEEVGDEARIREALRICSLDLAEKLQRKSEYCRSLVLAVEQADRSRIEQAEKLALPANTAAALLRGALRLLRRMPIDQPLLEVLLRASDLGSGSGLQLALIDENRHGRGLPHERRRSLETTFAFLRKRFGAGAILTASRMRQARRIGLWTYPLGHLLNEPVQVATDHRGRPVRFWRRGRLREVLAIQNHWRETEWFRGTLAERAVYRVETDAAGLCELTSYGRAWRLHALAD